MLIKLGELSHIRAADIQSADNVLSDSKIVNAEIEEHFQKVAGELKQIAPKAKDFLYFTSIFMHAAEAALIDEKGALRKDASGKEVTAHWEQNGESIKWMCSDKNIKPYKNKNGDIFPEKELLAAYKNWVGKPLCVDHQSSSVDMVRGVIVDTYYDRVNKRVVGLCALDKVNYPELARKVATHCTTSVSMGVGVGKAICTDCGKVARVEADFCNHMKFKTSYGEINVGLNPIELSIVTTGADPQAKIRHIYAAANSIAKYITAKEAQMADLSESAHKTVDVDHADRAQKLADEISDATGKLEDLKSQLTEVEKEMQQFSKEEAEEVESEEESDKDMETTASGRDGLALVLNELVVKVGTLTEKLNNFISNEETTMSVKKAYFQGGGGVNEPAPHQVKYPKEDSDKIRDGEDKQMLQDGAMGGQDGLFPGDEAKKKELQRLASLEARRMVREAALENARRALSKKEAYHQNGGPAGNPGEPTPGKPKYPKEDSDKIRDKADKQMQGASPFPGVGDVEGLYGDDLKKKQLLSRAKLSAKFLKAANVDGSDNLGESRWQVFANNKLVFTASVNELTGHRAEAMYDTVATEKFAHNLINKIKSDGLEKAASLFKGAQAAPAPAAPQDPSLGMPDMSMPMPSAAPAAPMGGVGPDAGMSGMPDAGEMNEGDAGNPKETLGKLVKELDNLNADMQRALDALNGEPAGEVEDFKQLGDELPAQTASLLSFQTKLANALKPALRQSMVELSKSATELRVAAGLFNSKGRFVKEASGASAEVLEMVNDAISDARLVVAEAYTNMKSFVKFARGKQMLSKRADAEVRLIKQAQAKEADKSKAIRKDVSDFGAEVKKALKDPGPTSTPDGATNSSKPVGKDHTLEQGGGPGAAAKVKVLDSKQVAEQGKNVKMTPVPKSQQVPAAKADDGCEEDESCADDCDMSHDHVTEDSQDASVEVAPDGSMKVEDVAVTGEDLKKMTAADRANYRAKVAAKAQQMSKMLSDAHPKGGTTLDLDTKPSADYGKVETLEETHKAMVDFATTNPKVKKAAQEIQRYVTAGQIDPAKDFPSLVAAGLDKDAVAYWKKYFSEVKDGGSEFASELVKETAKQKVAEEKVALRAKVSRAHDLASRMAASGHCAADTGAISAQVSEILDWDDVTFNKVSSVVDSKGLSKKASFPVVGTTVETTVDENANKTADLKSLFDAAFRGITHKR